MKACALRIALLVSFLLFTVRAQDNTWQKPIDEWDALDISLRTARSIQPKGGFVPNETTAVKIAEAVAVAQYGEKQISEEQPFRARLRDGVWTVKGTLHPEGAFGGTAVVKLTQKDGKISFMTHQE